MPNIMCMVCVLLGIWLGGSGRAPDPAHTMMTHVNDFSFNTDLMKCHCIEDGFALFCGALQDLLSVIA